MTRSINRRNVLRHTAAGLSFALTLGPNRFAFVAGAQASGGSLAPNAWPTIGIDDLISIVSPAAELGQGSFTTLPLILAEELDADWSKVRLIQPPVWDAKVYGNPGYAGVLSTTSSFAVWGYFKPLRIAGAQARRVLLSAAAEKWGVPIGDLTTEPNVV